MSRKQWMVAAVLSAILAACGGKDEGGGGSGGATSAGSGGASLEGLTVHQDLLTQVHLADVQHDGLFIDFGTPAQNKYSFGDWRSGWGRRGADGDSTYATVGQRGRIYFHAEQPGARTVRIRIKPVGTQAMTPYLNNEQLQSLQFDGTNNFKEYDFTLPADKVKAGENYLLLTFGGTAALQGEQVAAVVDWVRIVDGPSIPAGDYAAPTYDTLVRTVALGGAEKRAIVARRATTISFFEQVPEHAKLGVAVGFEGQGTATTKVFVTPEGGQRTEVFSHAANQSWHQGLVDLASYANQIVRIELVAEGSGAGQVAFAAPALYVPTPARQRLTPAKNVIVLLIDTLRADKMKPWNPRTRVRTPTIDSLAQQSTLFELAHSVENWTKPSVASVLTGLYPRTHLARASESVLPAGALMLSEHLKAKGFTTGTFLANGYVSDRFGFNQGWDHYTNYIREQKSTEAENVFREAGDWIEQNKDRRFFTYIQTIDPHVPYDPPAEYLRMYDARTDYTGIVQPRMTAELLERAKQPNGGVTFTPSDVQRLEGLHDGEITQHDHFFGLFIERLKSLGLWENTVLVVTSDHGEEFDDHGSWGHGHSVYEELLHVPLMVHLEGTVQGGRRIPQAVGTLSIPATVTDLVGVETMPNLEGPSLLPYLQGQAPARPAVAFSEWTDDRRVITAGQWKLVVRGNLTASLFDLRADPGERTQLELQSHPIAERYCRILLGQWSGATDRAKWMDAEQGRGLSFQQQNAQMDEAIRGQLRALGYAN